MKNITTTLAITLWVSLGWSNLAQAQIASGSQQTISGVQKRAWDIAAWIVRDWDNIAILGKTHIPKAWDIAAWIPRDGNRVTSKRNWDYIDQADAPPTNVLLINPFGATQRVN